MKLHDWLRPPRHILALFVVVAIVSASALGWLSWLLLDQDKAVERQRQRDRLEQAADRAASKMQSALAELDRLQSHDADSPPPGVIVVTTGDQALLVRPEGSLLYYPTVPRFPEAPVSIFAEAEQVEFARKDFVLAADMYRQFDSDPSDAVRAGALTRLARVLRHTHDSQSALEAYDELARIPDAAVDGTPANMLARDGRAAVFEESGSEADLRREAQALESDLSQGRWQLTQAEYEFYSGEAGKWLGGGPAPDRDAVARAEAVSWLWNNRPEAESLRLLATEEGPALVKWKDSRGIVAGPGYIEGLRRQALPDQDLLLSLSDLQGKSIAGDLAPSNAAVRTSAAEKLPWNLQVFAAPGPAARSAHLLLWILAVLALLWTTSGYFMLRAISREIHVSQLQSDFVAAVSHEFRSPLSSLCQLSEMLDQDRLPSDADRRKSYGILAREAERLRRLVESLLDFRRFESGADVYRFEPLEIGSFLKELVAEFQERVAPNGYSVELTSPSGKTLVRADREALTRAVWNLLDNAVKYSPDCRRVWVEVEREHHRVAIAVRDQGLGIPAGEQRDIFDKFVRGAESKSRRIKGAGLGLAMVRQIVRAHGGEVVLWSCPGEGSRFTMILNAVGGPS